MAKKTISNAHFVVFLRRRCQNVENAHETFLNTKIPFQNAVSKTIQYRMCLKFLLLLPRLVQTSQGLWSAVNTTRLNSSKDNLVAKGSRLSTKRDLSTLLNFLFPLVFYRRIFNLEMQNFSLKSHYMMNARQQFCWRMSSTKVSNWPASSPPPMWLPVWLLWGRGHGWVSLGTNVFPKPLELDIFSPICNGVRFFSALYTSWGNFFSVQDTISPRHTPYSQMADTREKTGA